MAKRRKKVKNTPLLDGVIPGAINIKAPQIILTEFTGVELEPTKDIETSELNLIPLERAAAVNLKPDFKMTPQDVINKMKRTDPNVEGQKDYFIDVLRAHLDSTLTAVKLKTIGFKKEDISAFSKFNTCVYNMYRSMI